MMSTDNFPVEAMSSDWLKYPTSLQLKFVLIYCVIGMLFIESVT